MVGGTPADRLKGSTGLNGIDVARPSARMEPSASVPAHAPRGSVNEIRPSLITGVKATRATAARAEKTPMTTRRQVRPRPPRP